MRPLAQCRSLRILCGFGPEMLVIASYKPKGLREHDQRPPGLCQETLDRVREPRELGIKPDQQHVRFEPQFW